MNLSVFRMIVLFSAFALLLQGCNLPVAGPEQPAPSATELPRFTPTESPLPPTSTPLPPTETPLPSATPTLTLTLEPSSTPTPAPPTAEVVRESNCRVGPAGNYTLVATYQPGKVLNVIARDLGGGFVFVQNPEKPEEQCYLLQNNIKISGDLSFLPQITPPPTPTPAPNFTVVFWKYMMCKDAYVAHFKVVNTGGSQFRSAYVKVTDQKRKQSLEQSLLAFDLYEGCIVARNIAPLLPGGTGYVQSAPYPWDPRSNRQTAVIMLCTEQDLKGACVTKTLEFQE
ncbi:MAG: hypothetical protein DDG60_04575 [Anaerolineae bacterium]|nr:MAG: hypothetical protein DDG60_04575 [Anaerolineae bacterium]